MAGSFALPEDLCEDCDLNAETDLCRIMTKYGSDKGSGWHNYTKVYDALFRAIRHLPVKLFEVGLGSSNPDIPSNMGPDGRPGASLYGWAEYFGHADTIVRGADIDRAIDIDTGRVKSFFVDQYDPSSFVDMWEHRDLQQHGEFDIIIDDGMHELYANCNTIACMFPHLKAGGIYIIEDVMASHKDRYRNAIINRFAFRDDVSQCGLVDIPNPHNHIDNVLLVVVKQGQNDVPTGA